MRIPVAYSGTGGYCNVADNDIVLDDPAGTPPLPDTAAIGRLGLVFENLIADNPCCSFVISINAAAGLADGNVIGDFVVHNPAG